MSKPLPFIVVQKARDLISDEKHWCQGAFARNKVGFSVSIHNRLASSYCAMGALMFAAAELCRSINDAADLAREVSNTVSPDRSLIFINDHVGHTAVLSLFDDAIAALQA
jgi:hypothetical protein